MAGTGENGELKMSRFRLPLAIACFCVMATAAWAAELAQESTRFFKTHTDEIDVEERHGSILFANRQVGLELRKSKVGFELIRLYGIAEDQDFLTAPKASEARNLFVIRMALDPKNVGKDERGTTKDGGFGVLDRLAKMGNAFVIGSQSAKSVSWRREKGRKQSVLHLEWKGMDAREDKGVLDVEVTVTLRAGDPLSYWRVAIRNRSQKYGIERARFPILPLAPIGEAKKNVFIYPKWRGGYAEDPFHATRGFGENYHTTGAYYPYYVNMQFWALYNKETTKGIYLATQDPTPNMTHFLVDNTPTEISWSVSHFPPNMSFAYRAEDFTLPYDCVVGPFRGDWYDACQIYREWAVKQPWCRKGRLSTRQDIPKWYKEAPLFFYADLADSAEGTHSAEANMPIAASHFSEFLKWAGMRLPVNWYNWQQHIPDRTTFSVPFNAHGRIPKRGRWAGSYSGACHTGSYPKEPALPNLSATCKSLRQEGGMVSPYTLLQMFDQGASENSPYAAEAKPHMCRDLYGAILKYPGYQAWFPCVSTKWWQNRMVDLCVTMLERENVGGFYLDVMHGMGVPCFWTPHGHSAGGGSSMTLGMHELARRIRDAVQAKDPDVITTGEDSTENMIDVIDGVLYQRTLRPENKVPLFAVVYQDYIPRYGLRLSVTSASTRYGSTWGEDHFFIECASLFVEGAQVGRLRLRPRDMSLSFQKPEHKEMIAFLELLLGYYRQHAAKKFLVYGQLLRPLEFREPSPMLMLPYKFDAQFPALMSGVFRSDDGDLGVFVVNASREDLDFQADLDLTRYGMAAGTVVDVDALAPDGASQRVLSRAKGIVSLKSSLPGHHMTMFRLKPTARR